jgi:hypothetical protein
MRVHRASHDLLAGTRFAEHEHADGAPRHALDD